MANKLTRRKLLKLLGSGAASVTVAATGSLFGFSAIGVKKRLIQTESHIDSAKRAELRKLLHEMRADLRRCKKALIARKKAGKSFGHLASQLCRKQHTIRNYHIALSELRGKRRKQIERPRKGNLPCEYTIARIKKRYS